jgi:hypothetical protein
MNPPDLSFPILMIVDLCVLLLAACCLLFSARWMRTVSLSVSASSFLLSWFALLKYHIDDAAISYAYARNLAHGLGFAPFEGAAPIEGYSNPLWTLLLAVSETAGIGAPSASKILSLLFALGSLYLLVTLARGWQVGDPAICLAVALTSTAPTFIVWSSAGLENPLLAVALLLAVREATTKFRAVPLGLSLATVALVRPEGIALAAATIFVATLVRGRASWNRAALAMTILFVPFGAYEIFRLLIFHVRVPNTFYAKLDSPLRQRIVSGMGYVSAFWNGPRLTLLGVAAFGWAASLRFWRILAVVLVPILGGTAFAIYAGGDWMPQFRFLSHLTPLLGIVIGSGLAIAVSRSISASPRIGVIVVVGVGASLVLLAIVEASGLASFVERQPCSMADVVSMAKIYDAVGIDACSVSPVTVATADIGGVLWNSPRTRVVDLAMLIEPDAAVARSRTRYWPVRFRRSPAPDLVFVHGPWAQPLTGLWDETLAAAGYRLIFRWKADRSDPTEFRFPPSLYARQTCLGTLRPETEKLLHGNSP